MIDQPGGSSNPLQGIALASGWALNDNAQVTKVEVLVDGVPVGTATYGLARPDVCNAFPGRPYCNAGVGWSYLLDSTTIPDGTHTLGIRVTAADGTYGTTSSTFSVGNWSAPDPMTITIDTPNAQSGDLFGAVAFGGWILDQNAPIAAVKVLVDGAPFGSASYGVNRPDVCAAFPGSFDCPNVGWSAAVDTTLLTNGTHTLTVTGTTPSGQSATAATTFTVAN
jgi:N-acetylmuramoyl-L-alanine amidase